MNDFLIPYFYSEKMKAGSTDVGDVSWVVPTAQIRVNCYSYGAGSHSWQWTGQGKILHCVKGSGAGGRSAGGRGQDSDGEAGADPKARAEFDKRMRDRNMSA